MTLETRNTWINYLQCKQGSNIPSIVKSLSYNICPEKALEQNTILGLLIDVLYRYNPDLEENCITEEDFCNIVTLAKSYTGKCNCK